jgi:hypothetical protein
MPPKFSAHSEGFGQKVFEPFDKLRTGYASSFGRSECALNFGNPKGGVVGAPFFAYFLWQDKESKLPPGNPRQAWRGMLSTLKGRSSAPRFPLTLTLSHQRRGNQSVCAQRK